MKFNKSKSGLLVPKGTRDKLPRFSLRVFEVYWESDIDKFRKLVESKLGIFEGHISLTPINGKNLPCAGRRYACVYQYYEDLHMEVLC